MTDTELTNLVKEISLNFFGKEFKSNARFNSRLRTTGGRYHLREDYIDINPEILERYDQEVLSGIIKHELCHYHLYHEIGKHSHNSKAFNDLLKAVGGSKYAPALKARNHRQKVYKIYQCVNCGLEYRRVKKINTRRFVCGKCRGMLAFIKETTN